MEPEKRKIVIIGAGILGLTTAISIQDSIRARAEAPYEVAIVAREWPEAVTGNHSSTSPDYASMWAGAHVRPIPGSTPQLQREAKWLKQTVAKLEQQASAEPWAGITPTKGRELFESPDEAYWHQTPSSFTEESGLRGYRQLGDSELPKGVKMGIEYDTYCINSPLYCASLLRRFIFQGGTTLKRDLRSEYEAFELFKDVCLVVNASGMGFGDTKCFPTRGQIALTDLDGVVETVTRQNNDGSWNFIIPRFYGGGTVIGGTKDVNDWDDAPRPATRDFLVHGVSKLGGDVGKSTGFNIIRDIVARRPTREGGVRLDLEHVAPNQHSSITGLRRLIHAYGAGGRGFELSWGIAADVAALSLESLSTGAKARL
ncbi:FAD dependent oxidoreductase [Geosmithia morbida]|uniref:FAD dependent oxidoreductase n=1 Tax=Geosmithia morbida TaxID=1094350 RepID=A0A9P4YQI8_9HYPO|nr:FAD dependent oxidoreductase [Geosmithia morbida]KAF4120915.1 FAD dependent oxidoreductase [Geosmithia morbida]